MKIKTIATSLAVAGLLSAGQLAAAEPLRSAAALPEKSQTPASFVGSARTANCVSLQKSAAATGRVGAIRCVSYAGATAASEAGSNRFGGNGFGESQGIFGTALIGTILFATVTIAGTVFIIKEIVDNNDNNDSGG